MAARRRVPGARTAPSPVSIFNATQLAIGWGYLAYAEHGSVDVAVGDLISRQGHIVGWQDTDAVKKGSNGVVLAYAPATNPDAAMS